MRPVSISWASTVTFQIHSLGGWSTSPTDPAGSRSLTESSTVSGSAMSVKYASGRSKETSSVSQ